METWFVQPDSIVRKIWGNADTALFIFAGAAAEFALNKAVDWLYFTGRLPADPLGRLFSTITYSRMIIFSGQEDAYKAIDKITAIHQGVEKNRGQQIPDWAYRDVLFLLIDYTIRSFELLDRPLTNTEKRDVFDVFNRVGERMQLKGLPENYSEWMIMRREHLEKNLVCGACTLDLYVQYRKHLGWLRYAVLKQVQLKLVPKAVQALLPTDKFWWLGPFLKLYKLLRRLKLEQPFKKVLLPAAYQKQIFALDILP